MQLYDRLSPAQHPPAIYFPDEVVIPILSKLPTERDLLRCSQVCRQWKKHADTLIDERDALCEKWGIFGVKAWKQCIEKQNEQSSLLGLIGFKPFQLKLGNIPRLALHIDKIASRLESMRHTEPPPLCILIPNKINGICFDVPMISKVFETTLIEEGLTLSKDSSCNTQSTPCYAIFTPSIVSNTGSYPDDEKTVANLAKEHHTLCSIPNAFEQMLCSAIYYIKHRDYSGPTIATCSSTNFSGRARIEAKPAENQNYLYTPIHFAYAVDHVTDTNDSSGVCMIEKFGAIEEQDDKQDQEWSETCCNVTCCNIL